MAVCQFQSLEITHRSLSVIVISVVLGCGRSQPVLNRTLYDKDRYEQRSDRVINSDVQCVLSLTWLPKKRRWRLPRPSLLLTRATAPPQGRKVNIPSFFHLSCQQLISLISFMLVPISTVILIPYFLYLFAIIIFLPNLASACLRSILVVFISCIALFCAIYGLLTLSLVDNGSL